jgi:hypothetical protein
MYEVHQGAALGIYDRNVWYLSQKKEGKKTEKIPLAPSTQTLIIRILNLHSLIQTSSLFNVNLIPPHASDPIIPSWCGGPDICDSSTATSL